jgi:hypothetical protein
MDKNAEPCDSVEEQASATGADKSTPLRRQANSGKTNRGMRAPLEGSGDVIGSGAGAGGGGGAEDYDSDPQGGGGAVRMKHDRTLPDKGADAPIHGSR